MFKNYLKIALRDLGNHWLYSAINIIGLAIGLASCLFILLYVRYEFSYESSFDNSDQIYRVSREYLPREGARARVPASNNGPVAAAMVKDFPEVVKAGRIFAGGVALSKDELIFSETELRYADQEILDIFSFEWLSGTADSALIEPNSIVLTESLAKKYFGSVDIVGQNIEAVGQSPMKITGVIADVPENSHLSLTGLISLQSLAAIYGPQMFQIWNGLTDFHTYLQLESDTNLSQVENKIPEFVSRNIGEEAAELSTMHIMNIRDIHLHSDRDEEWKPRGSIASVYSFLAIAFSILLIACINFMSISTARSSKRAREVGLRKSIGATRQELIFQFLGESALTAFIGMLFALILVELLSPLFSSFSGIAFEFNYLSDFYLLFTTFALILLVSFVAGSYPAFYLSAFKPALVLKGNLTQGREGSKFRNALVVAQFAIAIALVIATTVVYRQQALADTIELGFNKDQIVVLTTPQPRGYSQDWPAFKNALRSHPSIEDVTASHYLPFGFNDNQALTKRRGSDTETRIQYMFVDYDFFETYEINLIEGRYFSEDFASDTFVAAADSNSMAQTRFILNKSAADALGVSTMSGANESLEISRIKLEGQVVGVIEDTYFESIRLNVRPMLFILGPPQTGAGPQIFQDASIRVRAGFTDEALQHIDDTWKKFNANQSVNRHFLDDDFQAMYRAEKKQAGLFSCFSVLAIVIACFGLFGLGSFNAERRTKEIGVRKVMGGSVWSIVVLLTNDFSKLVLISNVIAWPVSYLVMTRWLENFAYRIELSPLIFIGSGLIALLIAWVTVGGTAAKAASAKPILALRYE